MKRKMLFFLLILLLSTNYVISEIKYRISGKVIYNGNGMSETQVICKRFDKHFVKEIKTDKDGVFYFYLPNGIYTLSIEDSRGFISRDLYKLIELHGKNVANILFFLIEGCEISGYIRYEDNTPVKNADVIIYNERSFFSEKTNDSGFYIINSISPSETTCIDVYPPASPKIEFIKDLTTTEGGKIENLNFAVPNKISISGKVIDKEDKNPLVNMEIDFFRKGIYINTSKSDDNGEFKAYNLSKGKYSLIIYDLNYNFVNLVIDIITDETKEILIEMEKRNEE